MSDSLIDKLKALDTSLLSNRKRRWVPLEDVLTIARQWQDDHFPESGKMVISERQTDTSIVNEMREVIEKLVFRLEQTRCRMLQFANDTPESVLRKESHKIVEILLMAKPYTNLKKVITGILEDEI